MFANAASQVIDVKPIQALVAMVPNYWVTEEGRVITPENAWFLMEKLTLPILERFHIEEDEDDDV